MTRQQKTIIAGAVLGGVVGAVGGYLFSRGMEAADHEVRQASLRSVPAGEIVRLVISVMAVLRSIAEMGEKV